MSWLGNVVSVNAGGDVNLNINSGNVYNNHQNWYNHQSVSNQFGGYVPYHQPVCQPICRPVCVPMYCALPPGDETKDDMAATDKDGGDNAALEEHMKQSDDDLSMNFATGKWTLIEDGNKMVNCEDPGVSISITYDGEKEIIVFDAPATAYGDNQKWNFMAGKWKLIEGGAMIANCETPDFCIPIAHDRDAKLVVMGEPMKPADDRQKLKLGTGN